jgi:ATP-dependent Clp protease protease subunit
MKKPNKSKEEKIPKVELKDLKIDQILLRSRNLFLFGAIDEPLAKTLIKEILALNILNKLEHENTPILIRINSGGGQISAGLSIIDAIKYVKAPIMTLISGEACSMAGLISVMGDKRIMTKNSMWMAHPPAGGVRHDYFQFEKDRIRSLELYEKIIEQILKKQTKLTRTEIKKAKNGELWLDAKECKKKGIVDHII